MAPASGTTGSAIAAGSVSSTLSGATCGAGGTITFTVFGPQASAPTGCSTGGTKVGTASVSGDGSYNPSSGFTAGTYWWYASYSGDSSNAPSNSGCGSGMTSTVVSPPPADLSLSNVASPNPVISGQPLTYTIEATNTGGQSASRPRRRTAVRPGWSFDPPLPDLTTLADGAPQRGRWSVSADGTRLTGGRWFAERRADGVRAGLDVTERWRPSKLPLLMRVVTTVVPVFHRWPTTYQWRADFGPDGRTAARWTRTSAAGADDYRRVTGT